MSVLDDLRRAEQQLVARLQELEPLVSEYEQLRQEADRLGLPVMNRAGDPGAAQPDDPASAQPEPADATVTDAEAEAAPAARPRRRRTSKPAGRTARRRPGGSRGVDRAQQVLELVTKHPGITVTAAGKELGLDPTGLYRPVRKLVAEGKVDKQGAELHPTDG